MATTKMSVRANYGPAPKGKANIMRQGQTEGEYGTDSTMEGTVGLPHEAKTLGKDA